MRLNLELSNRLFWQAGVTAVFAPFAATGGQGWVLIVLALAIASAGLGAFLRQGEPAGRAITIGFEAVALAIAALGVLGGHYIPGSIVGGVTLVFALGSSSVDPEPTTPLSALIPVQAGADRVTYAPVAAPVPVLVGAGAPAAAAPAPVVDSGRWAVDPTGHHHYRWWDGQSWTEHVATHGTTGVDPV